MNSTISPEHAAKAAKQILGFYPEIPASDPKCFAAGLVKTLSIFPAPVIARAVDPVMGIPGKIKFLNLAEIRELLDGWLDEHLADEDRRTRAARLALPPVPPDPEADGRVLKGLQELSAHLKSGFGPSTIGKP
jgi:hypothetical protein